MRKNLLNLFSKAVVLQYKFPYNSDSISIPRTAISTDEDSCLRQVGSNDDISNQIYNVSSNMLTMIWILILRSWTIFRLGLLAQK